MKDDHWEKALAAARARKPSDLIRLLSGSEPLTKNVRIYLAKLLQQHGHGAGRRAKLLAGDVEYLRILFKRSFQQGALYEQDWSVGAERWMNKNPNRPRPLKRITRKRIYDDLAKAFSESKGYRISSGTVRDAIDGRGSYAEK